jgi:hypothetical protein
MAAIFEKIAALEGNEARRNQKEMKPSGIGIGKFRGDKRPEAS